MAQTRADVIVALTVAKLLHDSSLASSAAVSFPMASTRIDAPSSADDADLSG
jgi:CBS-domain-containing membrane protein